VESSVYCSEAVCLDSGLVRRSQTLECGATPKEILCWIQENFRFFIGARASGEFTPLSNLEYYLAPAGNRTCAVARFLPVSGLWIDFFPGG